MHSKVHYNATGGIPLLTVTADVQFFADLPLASASPGEYYIVYEASGSAILGTKKKRGIYRSDGIEWIYLGTIPIDDTITSTENVWSATKITDEIALAHAFPDVIHKAVNYTVLLTDNTILITTGSSDIIITLPTAIANSGFAVNIVKIDSGIGNIVIDGFSTELINNQLTQLIRKQYDSLTPQSDGSNYYIV